MEKQTSLEKSLVFASRFGKVFLMSNSLSVSSAYKKDQDFVHYWRASLDLFVLGSGVSMEIKSERCNSPEEAVNELLQRLKEVLEQVGKKAIELSELA